MDISANKRILDLLAQGMTPVQVVNITGSSPQYLSTLVKDPEFMAALEEARKPFLKEADEEELISVKYLSLEHQILRQIENQIPSAELRDAVRALEVVSTRQEKRASRALALMQNDKPLKVVNNIILTLPNHAIPEYQLNSEKEVIAINQKGMSPMNSANVKALFASKQQEPVTI